MALAAGAGATLLHLGVPLSWTLLPLLVFLLPKPPFHRPGFPRGALAQAFLAGCLQTSSWKKEQPADCRFQLREGEILRLEGVNRFKDLEEFA